MLIQLKDATPEQIVTLHHKIGDDGEFREVVYRREADGPVRYPYNVPVTRLRTVQGHAGQFPRYDCGGEFRDPGEADGRTIVRTERGLL